MSDKVRYGSIKGDIDLDQIIQKIQERRSQIHDTVAKIEYITGMTIDELLELFAAGWTLTPPIIAKVSDLVSVMNEESED